MPESGVARALGPRGARGFTFPADSHEKTLHKGACCRRYRALSVHSRARHTALP